MLSLSRDHHHVVLMLHFARDHLGSLNAHIVLVLWRTAAPCDGRWLVSLVINFHLLGRNLCYCDLKWLTLLVIERVH